MIPDALQTHSRCWDCLFPKRIRLQAASQAPPQKLFEIRRSILRKLAVRFSSPISPGAEPSQANLTATVTGEKPTAGRGSAKSTVNPKPSLMPYEHPHKARGQAPTRLQSETGAAQEADHCGWQPQS
jgi:hypothetical protein